jgi:hypothetical protein
MKACRIRAGSRKQTACIGLLGLFVVTACGTTTGSQARSGVGGGQLGAPAAAGEGGSTAGPGGALANSSGGPGTTLGVPGQVNSVGGVGQSPSAPQEAGTAPMTGGAPTVPASGRGWDKRYVYVGVVTNQDISQFAGTVGVNTLDSGDQQKDAEAMIAELNAHGGLYGRQVRGLYYDVKSATDKETAAQAVCTYFTQDHPVIIVIDGAVQNDTASFRGCMRKARTVVLGAGAQAFDNKVFNDLQGWYYQLPYASWTTFSPALMTELNRAKYFTSWDTTNGGPGSAPVKVGILSLDTPVLRRIVDVMQADLRRLGHASSDVVFAQTQEDLQAAVLRFRSDNVTHVLDTDQFLFAFMQNAESQKFRPRYGISTPNAPGLLLQGTAPASQLVGAVGLGYFPALDVDARNDPGSAVAGAAPCRKTFAKHGLIYPADKRFALAYQYLFCDALQLVASATAQGGGFASEQVRAGVELVGHSLEPAFTFRNALSSRVRTEPGAGFALAWNTSCTCFRYHGPLQDF